MSLKKLSKQCSICRFNETCEHKQMEGVGYLEPATVITQALSASSPILLNEVPTIMYKDEIEKELRKSLELNLLGFGG